MFQTTGTESGGRSFTPSRVATAEAWSLSGPVKWFVTIGAVLGAVGGLRFAEWLWSSAVDELRIESTSNAAIAIVVLGIIVIVAVALKLWLA